MDRQRIGIIGFDDITALDLVGPSEAFANAFLDDGKGVPQHAYEIAVIGITGRPFVAADTGLTFKPQFTFADAPPLDTLIIPGGRGLRQPDPSQGRGLG